MSNSTNTHEVEYSAAVHNIYDSVESLDPGAGHSEQREKHSKQHEVSMTQLAPIPPFRFSLSLPPSPACKRSDIPTQRS